MNSIIMFDYISNFNVIITVLSVLVTALIGWQIFDAINLKREVRHLTKKIVERASSDIASISLAQQGMSYHNNKDFASSAQLFFNSISVRQKDVIDKISDEAYSYATSKLVEYNKKGITITADDYDEKLSYQNAARFTGDKDIIELADRIRVRNEK